MCYCTISRETPPFLHFESKALHYYAMVMYSKELFHKKKIMKLILLDLENKKENQLKIENVGI